MKLLSVVVAAAALVCAHADAEAPRELKSGDKGWFNPPTKQPTKQPTKPPTSADVLEGIDKSGHLWYKPRVCGGNGNGGSLFNPNSGSFGSGFDKGGFFKCVCANFWNKTGAIFKGQKEVCDWCDVNKDNLGGFLLSGRNRRRLDEDGLHPNFGRNVERFSRALDSPFGDFKGFPWWMPSFGTNYLSLACGCCKFWTAPPTLAPTTGAPTTTLAPSSAPTTAAPTTAAPTTAAPTTAAPTTAAPTTLPTDTPTDAPTATAAPSSNTVTSAPTAAPSSNTVTSAPSQAPTSSPTLSNVVGGGSISNTGKKRRKVKGL